MNTYKELPRVLTQAQCDALELRDLEQWMLRAGYTLSDEYAQACDRAIELRNILNIPQHQHSA